jgi:hypothetical protein
MRILLDAHISGRSVVRAITESSHEVRALDSEIEFEGLSDPEVLELAADQTPVVKATREPYPYLVVVNAVHKLHGGAERVDAGKGSA